MSSSSQFAFKTFNLANDIKDISQDDELFKYDPNENRRINNEKPWVRSPYYFKVCKISAVALIKMAIHARSGVPYEIMGIMQGKVVGNALVIVDSFALPVQGTETRVNAQNEANEYMVQYVQGSERVSRLENAIGWYHSHPGYGCWLSGIDVNTQLQNQKFQDPFVAVVIDPNRTISAGKVDIGAFRTFPENFTPADIASSEYQSIPSNKIEDFGVHANQYYSLEVQVFKSTLDSELLGLLWNKYWANTLSQSALISNRAYAANQLADLHQKLTKAQSSVTGTRAPVPVLVDEKAVIKSKGSDKKDDSALAKAVKDSDKIATEAQRGLIAQVLKDIVFSSRLSSGSQCGASVGDLVDTTMSIG